ncbi:hypothetical protein BJ878DRAFT_423142 [Calycina marina]|uniref:Domain of unknown function at the cortex 1 domain-containing protein n=1 Tax=Calycina marina TaxID=1763456 RepID=A0A9P7Z1D0_9HELO|nr:hypothetical protein BJ878DRAFT_423142 [Calycina marina]
MANNYILRVTAGPEYDTKTHSIVNVNSPATTDVDSDLIGAKVNVRIKDYRGLPRGSPARAPFFESHPKDSYAITFSFTPKQNVNGDDLVFGNDFDHPIRDRLPPGFSVAMKFIKWAVDPGLDGDVYADQPYLYGPLGGSVNALHIGDAKENYVGEGDVGLEVSEGGSIAGEELRSEKGIPSTDAARRKWFVNQENRKTFEYESDKTYGCSFYNGYLDFNEFALKLPVITIPIMSYWDGQGLRAERQKRSHTLRYTLKNRKTGKVLLVILFTLFLKEDVDEAGHVKEGTERGIPFDKMDKKKAEEHKKYLPTADDDVD